MEPLELVLGYCVVFEIITKEFMASSDVSGRSPQVTILDVEGCGRQTEWKMVLF